MTIAQTIKAISQNTGATEKEIEALIKGLHKRLGALEGFLYQLLLERIATMMGAPSGEVVAELYRLIDNFQIFSLNTEIKTLAKNLLFMADLSRTYFEDIGFAKAELERVTEAYAVVEKAIGIKGGKLVAGGFLDTLAKTDVLKQQLALYVIDAFNKESSLLQFTEGLKTLVVGNPDADGVLQRYYRQYAYDSFNLVHEMSNKKFAEGLGLKHFIYAGSIIKTSREFCVKRAGKAFTVAETVKWKDDPDLIDKATKDSYKPLLDRGRYNCRHMIKYISPAIYEHLKNGNSK